MLKQSPNSWYNFIMSREKENLSGAENITRLDEYLHPFDILIRAGNFGFDSKQWGEFVAMYRAGFPWKPAVLGELPQDELSSMLDQFDQFASGRTTQKSAPIDDTAINSQALEFRRSFRVIGGSDSSED